MVDAAAALREVLQSLESEAEHDVAPLAEALTMCSEVDQRLRLLLATAAAAAAASAAKLQEAEEKLLSEEAKTFRGALTATTAAETVAPSAEPATSYAQTRDITAAVSGHELPPTCGWCYTTALHGVKRCGKCKKRIYCSRDCQLNDWKFGGHRHWCGIAGELGHDVAVRSIGATKGRGLFALRRFSRGDKLLVERLTIKNPRSPQDVSEGVLRAAAELTPHDSTSLVAKCTLRHTRRTFVAHFSGILARPTRDKRSEHLLGTLALPRCAHTNVR